MCNKRDYIEVCIVYWNARDNEVSTGGSRGLPAAAWGSAPWTPEVRLPLPFQRKCLTCSQTRQWTLYCKKWVIFFLCLPNISFLWMVSSSNNSKIFDNYFDKLNFVCNVLVVYKIGLHRISSLFWYPVYSRISGLKNCFKLKTNDK